MFDFFSNKQDLQKKNSGDGDAVMSTAATSGVSDEDIESETISATDVEMSDVSTDAGSGADGGGGGGCD